MQYIIRRKNILVLLFAVSITFINISCTSDDDLKQQVHEYIINRKEINYIIGNYIESIVAIYVDSKKYVLPLNLDKIVYINQKLQVYKREYTYNVPPNICVDSHNAYIDVIDSAISLCDTLADYHNLKLNKYLLKAESNFESLQFYLEKNNTELKKIAELTEKWGRK